MADRVVSDEDVGGKYRYQPRPMPAANTVADVIAEQAGASKDNPSDLFRLFNALLGVENPPRGREDAVVTGPGRNLLMRNIPPRLFQYLDKSPMKVDVAAPGQNFPAELKGWANGGYQGLPAREGGTIGRIYMEPDGTTPQVLTHEAMHAATDLSSMNKLKRAGDPGVAPMEGFTPRAARPGLLSDTPTLSKATEGMIYRDPTLIDYGNAYTDFAKHHQIRAEVVNEGQARNAIQAVPELAKRKDVPTGESTSLRSWSNLFSGLKDMATQPSSMETNPSVSLDRVVRALNSMRVSGGGKDYNPNSAVRAAEAIQENPGRFQKFLEPFSDRSKVSPLGAGSETAAIRVGDKAVRFSPEMYDPTVDQTLRKWRDVSELPQVLGMERVERIPPFKQPKDMGDFSTLVAQQPLALPAGPAFRNLKDAPRRRWDSGEAERYFNNLWKDQGYVLGDSHSWNVGIPYPPPPNAAPHVIDLGAIYPKGANPFNPQRVRPANTDEILGIR